MKYKGKLIRDSRDLEAQQKRRKIGEESPTRKKIKKNDYQITDWSSHE